MTISFGFVLAPNGIELTIVCACKDWFIKRDLSNLVFVMDTDSTIEYSDDPCVGHEVCAQLWIDRW
jgi:hypothetical protein